MILEIGKIACIRPFIRKQLYLVIDAGSKFSGAAVGTEDTPSYAFGAVPVGAGKAAVNGKFDGFAAEFSLEPCTNGVVALPAVKFL